MSERTGILVFTLWYIAIAVAYYRGQLGGKSEEEETLVDYLTESQVSLLNETPKLEKLVGGEDNEVPPPDNEVPATVVELPPPPDRAAEPPSPPSPPRPDVELTTQIAYDPGQDPD